VYNVACIYSVASEKRPEQAEKYAAKAVTLLNDLTKTEYFRVPTRVKHLDADTDLDPLRKRDDFKAFQEAVKKSSAVGPNSR